MNKTVFLTVVLLVFTGCSTSVAKQARTDEIAAPVPPLISTEPASQAQEAILPVVISKTLGVIVLSQNHNEGDFIQFYNEDGSLWHRFTFFNDTTGSDLANANEDFRPFAFHRDYFLLTLVCVGKDKDRYEVRVNEESGLTKFANIDDKTLKFESWDEHVLEVHGIEFNQDENPLRHAPDGTTIDPSVFAPESNVYGREIIGEWLRIEWSNKLTMPDSEPIYETAWIQWKKEGRLLIHLSYLC